MIYLPDEDIEIGLHKVEVYFKDSNGQEVKKDWTFTIIGEEEDSESFNIFGYEISRRIAYIIGGGLGLIILAIFVPIIIFALWKDEEEETPPPPIPSVPKTSETEISQIESTAVQKSTNTKPMYTAPQPEQESNLTDVLNQIDDTKKDDSPPEPIL